MPDMTLEEIEALILAECPKRSTVKIDVRKGVDYVPQPLSQRLKVPGLQDANVLVTIPGRERDVGHLTKAICGKLMDKLGDPFGLCVRVTGEVERRCISCKLWRSGKECWRQQGYDADSNTFPTDDGCFIDVDYGYEFTMLTGPDFGCVHWEERDG